MKCNFHSTNETGNNRYFLSNLCTFSPVFACLYLFYELFAIHSFRWIEMQLTVDESN